MATKFPLAIVLSAIDKATGPLSRVHGSVSKFARNLRAVGKDLTTWVTLPAVAAGAAAVKLGLDFDRQFNRVRAAVDVPESTLAGFQDRVIQTGKAVAFGPASAASAFSGLVEEWHDLEQAAAGTRPVLELARAGSLEVGAAVKLTTNLLYAFRMETGQAAQVVDLLARAAKVGGTSVELLGADLQKVAPVAQAAGFGIEETAAALTVLYKSGLEGAEAGGQLSGLLRRLARADLPAAADGSRSLAALLDSLQARGVAGADALALFGEQGKAMAALLATGGAGLRGMREEIERTRSAADQGKDKLHGLEGTLTRLRATVERLAVAVSRSGLLDAVDAVVTKVVEWIDQLAEADPATLQWVVGLIALAAALGPVATGLGAVLTVLTALASPFVVAAAAGFALGAAAAYVVDHWQAVGDWISSIGTRMVAFVSDLLPDWLKRLLGLGGTTSSLGPAAAAANAPPAGVGPGAALVPVGAASAAEVRVRFENAPRGTKVQVAGDADVTTDVGYAMVGTGG